MSSWAKAGVKCVFIYEGGGHGTIVNDRGFRAMPVCRQVYEISGVHQEEPYGLFLSLVGFPDQQFFHISAFRPLVPRTQEQDVALFTPVLGRFKDRVPA